jgi:host factor-I protein
VVDGGGAARATHTCDAALRKTTGDVVPFGTRSGPCGSRRCERNGKTTPRLDEGTTMTMRQTPIQDVYLAEVKRQAVPVVIYLVNGFQLRGVVRGYDPFTIVLEFEHKTHLIYKHAVSTISPQGALIAPLVPEEVAAS